MSVPTAEADQPLDEADLVDDATGEPASRKPVSRWGLVRKRLVRRPQFWVGGTIVVAIVLFAFFGNLINIYGPTDQDIYNFNSAPSAQHWFGTDAIGQDLYARVIVGLRKSLLIGFLAAPAATLIAAALGSFSGYIGGWT